MDLGSDESIAFCGETNSQNNIAMPNADQDVLSGTHDGFAGRLTAGGGRLWATYVGGTALDDAQGVCFLGTLSIGVTGTTTSANRLAKAAGGTYDVTYNGGEDAFVINYSANGAKVWGTYLGTPSTDNGKGIAYVGLNQIVCVGNTDSNTGMGTAGAFQTTSAGGTDAFAASLTVSNGVLLWSTYNGSVEADIHYDVKPLAPGYFTTTLVRTPPIAGPVTGPHRLCTYTTGGTPVDMMQYSVGTRYQDRVAVRDNVIVVCTTMSGQSNSFGTSNGHQPVSNGGNDVGVLRFTFTTGQMMPQASDATATGQKTLVVPPEGLPLLIEGLEGPLSVTLHDLSGARVGELQGIAHGGMLELPTLPAGVYIGVATDARMHQQALRLLVP